MVCARMCKFQWWIDVCCVSRERFHSVLLSVVGLCQTVLQRGSRLSCYFKRNAGNNSVGVLLLNLS